MDQKVKDVINHCISCKANSRSDKPPPLPASPWLTLNIDYLGPMPNGSYLLVAVDQFSRFPAIEILGTTAVIPALGALTKIFSTHGLPYIIITDNGSPFNSIFFKLYIKKTLTKPQRLMLHNG